MIEKKIWCYLNSEYNYYVEMPQEMIDEFFGYFSKIKEEKKKFEASVCSDYENGLITKEKRQEILGDSTYNIYQESKRRFHTKYGYYPIKVPVYIKRAWLQDPDNIVL